MCQQRYGVVSFLLRADVYVILARNLLKMLRTKNAKFTRDRAVIKTLKFVNKLFTDKHHCEMQTLENLRAPVSAEITR